jgi:hypothetical protein
MDDLADEAPCAVFKGQMMRSIKLTIAVVSALALTGFGKILYVKVSESPGGLEFSPRIGGTANRDEVACVNSLEVSELRRNGYSLTWVIAKNGDCARLKTIRYGVLPSGFYSVKRAQKLTYETRYRISAGGFGTTGACDFVLHEGQVELLSPLCL